MKIFNWNISYSCNIEKICNEIENNILNSSFIITLQEVTASSYEYIRERFCSIANFFYSLNNRTPGKFDTKSRKLGVLLILSKDIDVIETGVCHRCLLPERTLFATIKYNNQELKVISLHSITGCDHKKAKSIQFYSFAELVDFYKPDILTFDANEPSKDHYEIKNMQFFDNKDKGLGAKTFFNVIDEIGLVDAFINNYDKSKFLENQPLTVSHFVGVKKDPKRYDFMFLNKKLDALSIKYEMERSLIASSDHSYIIAEVNI
jgi:hypothetical protein